MRTLHSFIYLICKREAIVIQFFIVEADEQNACHERLMFALNIV